MYFMISMLIPVGFCIDLCGLPQPLPIFLLLFYQLHLIFDLLYCKRFLRSRIFWNLANLWQNFSVHINILYTLSHFAHTLTRVLQDMVNRRVSIKMLIAFAKTNPSNQFILLTPQDTRYRRQHIFSYHSVVQIKAYNNTEGFVYCAQHTAGT